MREEKAIAREDRKREIGRFQKEQDVILLRMQEAARTTSESSTNGRGESWDARSAPGKQDEAFPLRATTEAVDGPAGKAQDGQESRNEAERKKQTRKNSESIEIEINDHAESRDSRLNRQESKLQCKNCGCPKARPAPRRKTTR